MPTLIPDPRGMVMVGKGFPPRLAKAVRELAKVLMRMPNQATP